jgi:outer membrane protein assembly factor BamB
MFVHLSRACITAVTISALFGQWERFRGPNGDGVSDTRGLPSEFGPDKNLLWRTAMPPGHSSPIISRGRVFVTASQNDELYTLALDTRSGKILWRKRAPRDRCERLHTLNHPASPTPAADGESVYVFPDSDCFPIAAMVASAGVGRSVHSRTFTEFLSRRYWPTITSF